MSTKKAPRSYRCVHPACVYRTDKRKSIYSHLVRTHGERKEDYECEYCSAVFTNEDDIETHLLTRHADLTFTYTCISRLENIINRCAKLATEGEKGSATATTAATSQPITPCKSGESDAIGYKDKDGNGCLTKKMSQQRTKASVNESLNNIAKHPRLKQHSESGGNGRLADHDGGNGGIVGDNDDDDDSCVSIESDTECQSFIAKPSGLEIKINLSTESDGVQNDAEDMATPPPLLEPSQPSSISPETATLSPPDITPSKITASKEGVVRGKATKYFDRLEVYHTTDRQGRRCCPFCPYKTTKNTIRVHLSGIHKIYFVKCSLCDYRAAFPHQIYQHGVKFHKTSNLKVIQLSKESRDRIINTLRSTTHAEKNRESKADIDEDEDKSNDSQNYEYSYEAMEEEEGTENGGYDEMEPLSGSEGENGVTEEEKQQQQQQQQQQEQETEDVSNVVQDIPDQRVFKAPKCQTSKTDYYTIKIENGVYMYNCNFCDFQTPVRSTIYTHKYRHEHKAYMCGYCPFTSAPRSNVVHHCRGKHKNMPIFVVDAPPQEDEQPDYYDNDDDVYDDTEPREEDGMLKTDGCDMDTMEYIEGIKQEPLEDDMTTGDSFRGTEPVIKVPHYTRSTKLTTDKAPARRKVSTGIQTIDQSEFKLAMNKLYKVNPDGSPRYMCTVCSFACDTHPKMKHHLYRHRPQQYKCPYCDHRKYPRSYVVRHVRDTHRGKPIRVIDLSKDPSFVMDPDNAMFLETDTSFDKDMSELDQSLSDAISMTIKEEPRDYYGDTSTHVRMVDIGTNTPKMDCLSLAQLSMSTPVELFRRDKEGTVVVDDMFTQSSDVSPNFHEAVFTSAPMIESLINRPYEDIAADGSGGLGIGGLTDGGSQGTGRSGEKKKSMKNYRVNESGDGPRYVCNVCNYGTQNYKTIHNHMYRHDAQRYQCPYCGYRRSPRSFVENHIREVHKGQPLVVRELSESLQSKVPEGSPRQTLKKTGRRIEPGIPAISPAKRLKTDGSGSTAKPFVKWPAPKPASQVRTSPASTVRLPPPLQIHGKPPKTYSNVDIHPTIMAVLNTARIPDIDGPDPSIKGPPPLTKAAVVTPSTSSQPTIQAINNDIDRPNPFKFKEASRTTFKTMYKCVFDPEVCNHISKDKSKMKQHLFMHVEYKPWACDFCEMTASQSSHIKNHVRTEHPGVSEMSFKYKKHNYLEKHIESFLAKGLFTVPINEYRAILDMKGNTKTACKKTFAQDQEGFMLCPYCDYKTKSGGITDHVKMKHLQPRFKCHWCDFRAFYKSEVRKHHRKERSHLELEFKIQELDLVEMMAEYKEMTGILESLETHTEGEDGVKRESNLHNGIMDMDDDDDDDDDMDDSSSNGSLNEGVEEMLLKYSGQQLGGSLLPETLNTEVDEDGSMKLVPVEETPSKVDQRNTKEAKFKCGHCTFSADLRVKVKMHCSKRHPNNQVEIIELANKTKSGSKKILSSVLSNPRLNNNMSLNANDLKGTKFELDLRKAGVSKLNLASLFPNSARLGSSSPDSELSDNEGKDECNEIEEAMAVDKDDDAITDQSGEFGHVVIKEEVIEIDALDDENENKLAYQESISEFSEDMNGRFEGVINTELSESNTTSISKQTQECSRLSACETSTINPPEEKDNKSEQPGDTSDYKQNYEMETDSKTKGLNESGIASANKLDLGNTDNDGNIRTKDIIEDTNDDNKGTTVHGLSEVNYETVNTTAGGVDNDLSNENLNTTKESDAVETKNVDVEQHSKDIVKMDYDSQMEVVAKHENSVTDDDNVSNIQLVSKTKTDGTDTVEDAVENTLVKELVRIPDESLKHQNNLTEGEPIVDHVGQ